MSGPEIPWGTIADTLLKIAPSIVSPLAGALRAQGFEIPRDPATVKAEATSEFEARIAERFHHNTEPPDTEPTPPFDEDTHEP